MVLKLKRVLENKGCSMKEYSSILGISEKSLYNKLYGNSEFTVGEFQRLKTLLPEYDLLYLIEPEGA